MPFVDGLIVAAVVVVAALIALAVRRMLLRRGGATVDLSVRLRRRTQGRGWALGMGRYDGDRLLWWRAFSFVPTPRRTLVRHGLRVVSRRRPTGPEALALLAGSVILECRDGTAAVELAMNEAAVPGFLAWLEATPGRGPEI